VDKKQLLKYISEKKKEMIRFGMNYGLRNEKTVKCSQELNKLLNTYQAIIWRGQ
jgi:stage 0 sporulation regulatory protein